MQFERNLTSELSCLTTYDEDIYGDYQVLKVILTKGC